MLLLSYGQQRVITSLEDKIDLAPVFFSRNLSADGEKLLPYDMMLLRRGEVEYLVVDHRLTRALPKVGVYYDLQEPGAYRHDRPIPRAAFAKFDRLRLVSRVFDSGDIVIYDVSRISGSASKPRKT